MKNSLLKIMAPLLAPKKKNDRLDEYGRELLDPTPIAPPIGYRQDPPLSQLIREMVQSEKIKAELQAQGFETIEEADDFDIEDDPIDPETPYEAHFNPPPPPPAPSPEVPPKPPTPPEGAKSAAPEAPLTSEPKSPDSAST